MDAGNVDSEFLLKLGITVSFIANIVLVLLRIRSQGRPQKIDVDKQPLEVIEGRKPATMDNIKVVHHRMDGLEKRLNKIEEDSKKERSEIVAEIIEMREQSNRQFENLNRAIGRLEGARFAGQ